MSGKASKIFKGLTIVWPLFERIYNWWITRKAKKKAERDTVMNNSIIVKIPPPEEGAKITTTTFRSVLGRNLLIKAIDGELPQNTSLIIRKGGESVFETLSKILNRDNNFRSARIFLPAGQQLDIELTSPTPFKKGGSLEFAVEDLR